MFFWKWSLPSLCNANGPGVSALLSWWWPTAVPEYLGRILAGTVFVSTICLAAWTESVFFLAWSRHKWSRGSPASGARTCPNIDSKKWFNGNTACPVCEISAQHWQISQCGGRGEIGDDSTCGKTAWNLNPRWVAWRWCHLPNSTEVCWVAPRSSLCARCQQGSSRQSKQGRERLQWKFAIKSEKTTDILFGSLGLSRRQHTRSTRTCFGISGADLRQAWFPHSFVYLGHWPMAQAPKIAGRNQVWNRSGNLGKSTETSKSDKIFSSPR